MENRIRLGSGRRIMNLGAQGFSLIELMIVIAIMGILVAVLLPQLSGMSEDAMKSQAQQSLVAMRDAAIRYNVENPNRPLSNLDWLVPKYMKELEVDPWFTEYTIYPASGVIASAGPDRSHQTPYDNIEEWYLPKLMIESAYYVDTNNDQIINSTDTFRIRFTKPCAQKASIDADGKGTPGKLEVYKAYVFCSEDANGSPQETNLLQGAVGGGAWRNAGERPPFLITLDAAANFDMAVVLTLNLIPKTSTVSKNANMFVNTDADQVLMTYDSFLSVKNTNPVLIKGTDRIKHKDNIGAP